MLDKTSQEINHENPSDSYAQQISDPKMRVDGLLRYKDLAEELISKAISRNRLEAGSVILRRPRRLHLVPISSLIATSDGTSYRMLKT